MQELLIVLVILLLLFGGSRLPQLARGIGKSIREFKKGVSDREDDADPELADVRREKLREGDRLREEELASDKFTVNKPR